MYLCFIVAGDVFVSGNSPVGHITISLVVIFIVIVALVFLVVKCRRHRRTSRKHEKLNLVMEEEREMVKDTGESLNIRDLDEKETDLNKKLKDLEEEYIYVADMVKLFEDKKKDAENRMVDVKQNRDKYQRELEAKQKQGEKHSDISKLETRKQDIEKALGKHEYDHKQAVYMINLLIERKKVLDDDRKKINEQLKEIKKKRDEGQTMISSDQ
ncbi:cancer-associated gene 1 protein homolog [Mugil cephalus]|uniref:cancer-associated gene 1 protein homolog n=1 Tax=Mugil cephalus TaxID=48193 RepID=UPI001FB6A881|nr:cancer-associated gene 1 protein homolog [Mugil cephalus]